MTSEFSAAVTDIAHNVQNACAAIAVTRRGPATAPTLGELAQLLD